MSLTVRRLVCAAVITLCTTLCVLVQAEAPALALTTHQLSGSIGEKGTGNGQFEDPVAVAVNDSKELLSEGAGDVYVADRGNRRVERFSATGVYLGQFNGTGTYEVEGATYTKGAAPPTGQFTPGEQGVAGLAVDSSDSPGDPSKGDVYVLDSANDVVDKFSATGEYEGQLEGLCGSPGTCAGSVTPFFHPLAVAVDPAGNVWVAEDEGEGPGGAGNGKEDFVSEFSTTGIYIKQIHIPVNSNEGGRVEGIGPAIAGLVTDESGYLYEILRESGPTKIQSNTGLTEFGWGYANGTKKPYSSKVGRGALGVAYDLVTQNILFADSGSGGEISEYNLQGELSSIPLTSFGVHDFEGGWTSTPQSIAVSNSDSVYVTEPVTNRIELFDKVVLPNVTLEPASHLSETGATLSATVNPSGQQVTVCTFEYGVGDSYSQSTACEQTLSSGNEPMSVSAKIAGLTPGTEYEYRVRVGDASGVNPAEEVERFTTYSPVSVGGDAFSGVGPGSVTLQAEINPGGRAMEYQFEYGPTTSYGSVTPKVPIENGHATVSVHTQVSGLVPGTTYHFRVLATDEEGVVREGADVSFSTFPSAMGGLPDGRVYEMVTPVANDEADVYLLEGWEGATNEGPYTENAFRAAADGDAVAYESAPTVGGNGVGGYGTGNAQLATRSPSGGWTQVNITPAGVREVPYLEFSDDLSTGILSLRKSLGSWWSW